MVGRREVEEEAVRSRGVKIDSSVPQCSYRIIYFQKVIASRVGESMIIRRDNQRTKQPSLLFYSRNISVLQKNGRPIEESSDHRRWLVSAQRQVWEDCARRHDCLGPSNFDLNYCVATCIILRRRTSMLEGILGLNIGVAQQRPR